MYGSVSAGSAAAAGGTLAFTGDHIASEVVLAVGLIFMGAAFVRASVRRRPIRP
ncbi:MAG TPA: hypothetical protein VL961_02040 [Acidimicrobiales bacterium]|nr:hypothetical protein [Acidimicrobiales bacterium]